MTLRFLLAGAFLAVGSPVAAQEAPPRPSEGRIGYANPSAAIAAEMALSRLAQEKGLWTALRENAAPDAVLFNPNMVLAMPWLKDRPNPLATPRWQVRQVWSSCDGSMMITAGGLPRGWFITVWQRQEKGGYRWVLHDRDESGQTPAEADMIAASVADCPPRPRRTGGEPPSRPRKEAKPAAAAFDPTRREGRSRDGSLTWRVIADSAGKHEFDARMLKDGAMRDIPIERAGSPAS